MNSILKLFKRERQPTGETAPQLTLWERRAQALPTAASDTISHRVLNEMQRDPMVQTCLQSKKLAVVAAKWSIDAKTDAGKRRAEFVHQNLDEMEGSVGDVLIAAMDAFAKGWSLQEAVFEPHDRHYRLAAVRAKDPARFGLDFDEFGKLRGLHAYLEGERPKALPREKFLVYIHNRNYGNLRGASDLVAAHKPWQAKSALLAAWKVHLEKYAMPTILGRYQRGLPADEQTAILRALQEIQSHAAVVCPSEVEVGLLGGDRAASTGFQEAIEFHNREIARAILGQTLTTDEGRRVGSMALGKVHLQVFLLQVESLRKLLADSVMTEQLVRPLVQANFGPGEIPKFRFEPLPLDVFQAATVGP